VRPTDKELFANTFDMRHLLYGIRMSEV